jgi:hypothetical protein
MSRTAWLAALLLLALAPAGAAAQCLPQTVPPDLRGPCEETWPAWTGEMAVLGANALLGGFSAGVLHRLRGGSFGDAFLKGAAGGAVVYGGKRIAAERFGGAGLVGRQVAAVGASMTRNAGEGRTVLQQVALPLGPTWLYLQADVPRVRLRADVVALGWLVYALREPELRLDAGMSLSAGAPVFLADGRLITMHGDSLHASGVTEPGLVMLSDVPEFGREYARRTFGHERIHVLQMDQLFLTVTGPATDRALDAVPGLRRVTPYIDLNLSSQLLRLLAGFIPDHLDRPWETEAIFLSTR